jgi:hypothetical protein
MFDKIVVVAVDGEDANVAKIEKLACFDYFLQCYSMEDRVAAEFDLVDKFFRRVEYDLQRP